MSWVLSGNNWKGWRSQFYVVARAQLCSRIQFQKIYIVFLILGNRLLIAKKGRGKSVKTILKMAIALLLLLLISSTFAFQALAQSPVAGISLTKTPSAAKVVVGSSVSYLYNVTNTGETALTGAIYDDEFGAVGSFVGLQPGGWVGFNVTHVIMQNMTNVATAYGVDSFGQNVTASSAAFVQVYVPVAGISLTKTPSATKVVVGSSVSYLYNVTNTGETALTGAIYDDEFGAVGSFVDLQPGGWAGFNVTHVITQNTYNVATAYGVDQYGNNVTSTASAYVSVCNPWGYFRWFYYIFRWICYLFRWC